MTYLKAYFIWLFFITHGILAQNGPKYPELSASGSCIEELIPLGWRILSHDKGDLNGDGLEDVVFAIQSPIQETIEYKDGYESDTLQTNPRILGIYFGKRNGKLKKVLQSNSFIINRSSPVMDEPFKGIQILQNGELQINFYIWQCRQCTSWSSYEYHFNFQNNVFELVEFEQVDTQRVSGEEITYSIEFRNRTMTIYTSGSEQEDPENQIIKFELLQLQSIKSLGEPFQWLFQNISI